jgi:hypothetical protein
MNDVGELRGKHRVLFFCVCVESAPFALAVHRSPNRVNAELQAIRPSSPVSSDFVRRRRLTETLATETPELHAPRDLFSALAAWRCDRPFGLITGYRSLVTGYCGSLLPLPEPRKRGTTSDSSDVARFFRLRPTSASHRNTGTSCSWWFLLRSAPRLRVGSLLPGP